MKRKNLILSLVCSIALTIALVTFTIISLVPKTGNGNGDNLQDVTDTTNPSDDINAENDGSAEKPYIISDAASFISLVEGKYLDENGNYIDYTQKDADGAYVNPALAAGLHFELSSDIDMTGAEIGSIFNKGVAFNGTIDGKGFALSNITIEVTKENLTEFMYLGEKGFRAHIALFGKLDGAKITNLSVNNISVKVSTEVLEYLRAADTTFVQDNKNVMHELTTSLFAGLTFDSEIAVNVQGTIDGFAYCFREDKNAAGTNAVGGLVAAAVNTNVSNSTVDAEMLLDGKNYFVGGLVGKAYNVIANETNVTLKAGAAYNQVIYIGGAFGYAEGANLETAQIALDVAEKGDRVADDMLVMIEGNKNLDETVINVAGIVPFITANNETQLFTIKNVKTNSNVAIDGNFAGAICEVWSTAADDVRTVIIENVSATSNVDTLKAYGFAKNMKNAQITSVVNSGNNGYDVAITGKVRLTDKAFYMIYKTYANNTFVGENGETFETLTVGIGRDFDLTMKDIVLKAMLGDRFERISNPEVAA